MRQAIAYTVLILCSSLWSTAATAKLYKWVDADGGVHYSDRVPPDAVGQERSVLDKRGIEVERTDRARTPEEIARDEELARLRAIQQQLRADQEERDRVLLNTFRTEEDLLLARERKLEVVDAHINLAEANIRRLKSRLATMQTKAATTERQGEAVSPAFRAEIETTRRQIEETYAAIVTREKDRQSISAGFDQDLTRLRELRNLRTTTAAAPAPVGPRRYRLLDTLVQCDTASLCATYWERAGSYAQREATTQLQLTGERILLTASPAKDQDISVTVSRIPEGGGVELIFMDVQCRNSPLGAEFCNSPAVQRVRAGFKDYVTGQTAAAAPATPAQ